VICEIKIDIELLQMKLILVNIKRVNRMINKRARKVAEELITIDPAKESDLDSILNLLAACNLPSEGLSDHIIPICNQDDFNV